MRQSRFFLAVLVVALFFAGNLHAKAHHTKFAVFFDPHLYDVNALGDGKFLDLYMAQDRKMLRESEAILSAAVEAILDEKVDFVIVSGDLTKDGERVNHLDINSAHCGLTCRPPTLISRFLFSIGLIKSRCIG